MGPLVEGLPVSLSTGAVYGTAVDPVSSNLFVSISTFNNGGAASSAQGDLPDCIYSAAILKVDIRKQNVSRVLQWTSDDPAVARLAQTAEQSGISLYAEGIRSAFELSVFLSGDLIAVDGGANLDSGPRSISCSESVPFEVPEPDKVIRVEQGRFYGHANRARHQCVFVSALLSDEEAQQLVPDISLPLFTTADAIAKNVVVGSPTGTLEYTAAWFSSLRGSLMAVEEDPLIERGEGLTPGTASYNLETGEIRRVANGSGISAVIDVYGSVFGADFERNRITISVPNVTRKMRKERAVRAVWPSKGLQGSKVHIVVTGSYSRAVTIGGYKAMCNRGVRQVNTMREAFSHVILGDAARGGVGYANDHAQKLGLVEVESRVLGVLRLLVADEGVAAVGRAEGLERKVQVRQVAVRDKKASQRVLGGVGRKMMHVQVARSHRARADLPGRSAVVEDNSPSCGNVAELRKWIYGGVHHRERQSCVTCTAGTERCS
ncbi:hypothetical protein FGB62_133g00 [Gracilaria domingensis]|nr:hypothetical protein FGB62_564g04 [Gracilaria domingensis]KAI0559853.1 hypothetical protein FGB62_133g00 [Gracilaria domingensis]